MLKLNPSLTIRALIVLLLLASTARAQLDPGVKKPYELQVVLQVGSNRVFTPLFQEQLARDVSNQLKLAFADLARINVVRAHPLLGDIEARGLDAAIEAWDSLSERTTHFVLLDYRAGNYQILTRFHDGPTGLPGSLTKSRETSDRAAVAAVITALVEASFSPVGTVTAVAKDGRDVTLTLQGGELGVPLDRWVQAGNVFAVSRLAMANGKPRAERVEWALLEAIEAPSKGVCKCRYRHRYQEDTLSDPATLGYRALKLPTGTGVVKVQLLDDTSLQPLKDVSVRLQRADYKAKPEDRFTDRDGVAVSKASYAHFAWVQVLSGDTVRAQFPVELIEGRTVVARVKLQEDRESLVSLDVRRDAWQRRVLDNVRLSSERALDLSRQLNQSLEAARDTGKKSIPLLDAEIKYLDREFDELGRLAAEKKVKYDLTAGQQQIDELRKKAKELQAFVDRIDGVLKNSAGDDKALGLHKLLERAQLLEAEAQFDEAIRIYDQVVQANPDATAKVKAKLDKLKADWKEQGPTHVKAREFVYKTWPTLDIPGLGKNLDEATLHLAVCKEAGDKLTPQKLLLANVTHMVNLKKQLETLKRRDSEDNRNQAKSVVQITERLLRLHSEATAWVGAGKK